MEAKETRLRKENLGGLVTSCRRGLNIYEDTYRQLIQCVGLSP